MKTKPKLPYQEWMDKFKGKTKVCVSCGIEKDIISEFNHKGITEKRYSSQCNDCTNKQNAIRVRARAYRTLLHYSINKNYPICECCGETNPEFLALDHIEGGGNKHMKEIQANKAGYRLRQWVVDNNYPKGFRILCHNCNQSLGLYGYCPHKENRKEFESAHNSFVEGAPPRNQILTKENVLIIKKKLLFGESVHKLSRKYGVNAGTIYSIKEGKNWKEIECPTLEQLLAEPEQVKQLLLED